MIDRLIELSLKHRLFVLLVYAALAGAGIWAFRSTPVDAIPDLSENQIIVFGEWPGRSPQEVEDQVTYPLTSNLQGLTGVRTVRASSTFGLSMINIIYDDGIDLNTARSRVLERLNLTSRFLPDGVSPTLGPDATAAGQIFWYTVDGPYDPDKLRSLQDWFIRYQINSVPGVAEVGSVGGFVREYQIDVDPVKLRAYNIALHSVVEAVGRSNNAVGAKVVEANDREYVLRGVGLLQSTGDIEKIVVGNFSGTPVSLHNISAVQIGPEFRRGVLDRAGLEAVGGVVVARSGANARQVIADVKAKIASIQPGLPSGVRITPFYDRSELIDHSLATLRDSFIEEVALVTLVHIIFLWHLRSIIVVTLPLPLSVAAAFLLMRGFGISSNIMSLGGITIAIGILVDAGIVITENVLRHSEQSGSDGILNATARGTRMVGRPIFLSLTITILSFLPVFALSGMEGKLFHPLAFTKTFALTASAIMAVTLVPVLCTFFIRGRPQKEEDNPVMRGLRRIYRPMLIFSLNHRPLTLTAAASLFLFSAYLMTTMGTEFMPVLNEETTMWMPVADPSISLTKASELLANQDRIIASDPAVQSAVGKIGRAETATDPAPINMTETMITLKPRSEWPAGTTREGVLRRLEEKLRMPGITSIWTQPIQNRVDMLSTGIRTEVGVKVFGTDIVTIEAKALEIEHVLRTVRGAVDLYAERAMGVPYLEFQVDRDAVARLGITTGEVQDVVETALGGKNVTALIQGRERYPVRIRYARDFREDMDSFRNVLVSAADGTQVPLGEMADFKTRMGPAMINSENGLLRGAVLLNVRNRDIGSFLDEAKRVVASQVSMPPGYYVEWSGQFEHQIRAKHTLQIVIPTVLLIIVLLLYFIYHSIKEALHVLLAVPFALTGGIILVKLLGYNLSVPVWVGFIALFGTAVQTGVVMVIYLQDAVRLKAKKDGSLTKETLRDGVIEGALLRLRPKVMTVATVVASLVPVLLSSGTGAEIMKPLAAPVLGGMASSLVHVLIITPVIFSWLRERDLNLTPESHH